MSKNVQNIRQNQKILNKNPGNWKLELAAGQALAEGKTTKKESSKETRFRHLL